MQNLYRHLETISDRLRRAGGAVVMLDFDGTLSPLARTPGLAFLHQTTKRQLVYCSSYFPIAIISGRALKDIKERVGMPGLIYAGNHGLEWQIGRRRTQIRIPRSSIQDLMTARYEFKHLQEKYPGVVLEYKRLALAIHYRAVAHSRLREFYKEAQRALHIATNDGRLIKIPGKKVFELRPNCHWTKGHFARFIYNQLCQKYHRRLLAIYIGDDATDEDAFRTLSKGVTIRIGKSKGSSAQYYIRNQQLINDFLSWLPVSQELE